MMERGNAIASRGVVFPSTWSGSEAGSYLRFIDFVYHSTLGVKIKKDAFPQRREKKREKSHLPLDTRNRKARREVYHDAGCYDGCGDSQRDGEVGTKKSYQYFDQ